MRSSFVICVKIAEKYVENGDIVDLSEAVHTKFIVPTQQVEKGKETFNPNIHIIKSIVGLFLTRKIFTLSGVSYERVEIPTKKTTKKSTTENESSGGGRHEFEV